MIPAYKIVNLIQFTVSKKAETIVLQAEIPLVYRLNENLYF